MSAFPSSSVLNAPAVLVPVPASVPIASSTSASASSSSSASVAASGGLSQEIERHLRNYFAAHEHGRLPSAGLYDRILREVEFPLLVVTLEKCEGNQLKAARLLGLNRNTLRKKLRALGLLAPEKRRAGKARHHISLMDETVTKL